MIKASIFAMVRKITRSEKYVQYCKKRAVYSALVSSSNSFLLLPYLLTFLYNSYIISLSSEHGSDVCRSHRSEDVELKYVIM